MTYFIPFEKEERNYAQAFVSIPLVPLYDLFPAARYCVCGRGRVS